MKFLNDIVLTGAGADLTAPATVTFSGLAATTETNAVVINSSGVLSKRTLGSNAFNSTGIPTGNAIIDWTASGAGTIHASNYIENVVQTAVTGRAAGTEDWVNSRGENLFSNGSSLLGNIVNMPGFTFDGTEANNSPGSFKWTGTGTPFTSEFIPVDASRKYKMQYDAKTENGVGRYYGFTACFDVDGNGINASNHMYRANTLTTLAVTLVNGATTITLASSANWNNAGTAGSSNHLRSLIIWNYANSYGYVYPENTYSRKYTSQAWQPGGINFSSHVITLRVPWAGGTVASGTKVSNGSSGGTYKYNVMSNKLLTTDWVRQSGYMDGVDYSGTNDSTKFPPGTAKVKLGWLMNYNNLQSGEVAWFTNINVGVAAHEDNEIAEAIERATDSNKFTDSDHTKLNGIETSATADQSNAEIRAAVAAATDSQVFTDADHTKLNTIATNATANASDATLKARANHTGTQAYSTITGTPTIPSGNAIIDWTSDQGGTNIHAGNYTDTNTVYTHPTSAGNKHIPTGGESGQFLKYTSSGTAVWATPSYTTNTNTTYTTATSSTLGLVKIGYTESGKNYPVELSSGKMYVNVPWANTQNNDEEDAAEGTKGVVELATNEEVIEGTDSGKATTSRGVKGAIDSIAVPIAGNKTISGTKTFSSTIAGDINGNSATTSERTITTGEISAITANTSKVGITTGSQTIAGSKTFSSPIKGQVIGIASHSGYINKTAAQFASDGTDKVYIGSNNYGWNDSRDYATNLVDVDAPVIDQNDQHNGIICPVNLSQVSIMSQVRMNAADGTMQVRVYKMARATGVNTSNLALTQIATASVSTVNGRMTTLDATGSTAVSAGDLIIVGFGKTSGGNGQKPRINFTLTGTTV